MVDPAYQDLSNKIEKVKDELGGQLTTVLVEMGKLTATVTNGLSSIGEMKGSLDKTREIATKAKDSADSGHKRTDEIKLAIKPITEGNLVERVKDLEDTNKKLNFIVFTSLIGGAISLLYLYARGGGGA